MKRISQLDGVRGLACIFVLVHHYTTATLPQELPWSLGSLRLLLQPFLESGVDLFFVLSGFLIVGILLDHRGSQNYFPTFYIRRVCRIFPVYYALLAAFIALQFLAANPAMSWPFGNPAPLWTYATFTQNFPFSWNDDPGAYFMGITWSLAVEEQFYLLFPLVVFALPRRALPVVVLAAIAVAPIVRLIIRQRLGGYAEYMLLPCRMDTLMMGALVALAVRDVRIVAFVKRNLPILYGILIAMAVALQIHSLGHLPMGTLRYSVIAATYGLLILVVVLDSGSRLSRFFNARLLTGCGLISYAVYMFHQGVSGMMHGAILGGAPSIMSWPAVGVTAASAMITIALAMLSYRYLERPIRNYGKRFIY
jgi:peptidoglycan/LPS O-acetylase OafA/YrhL